MVIQCKKGETIAAIARRFHAQEGEIRTLNHLAEGMDPWDGMRLVVHGYLCHWVSPQDTLSSIAALYAVRETQIECEGELHVGCTVIIRV